MAAMAPIPCPSGIFKSKISKIGALWEKKSHAQSKYGIYLYCFVIFYFPSIKAEWRCSMWTLWPLSVTSRDTVCQRRSVSAAYKWAARQSEAPLTPQIIPRSSVSSSLTADWPAGHRVKSTWPRSAPGFICTSSFALLANREQQCFTEHVSHRGGSQLWHGTSSVTWCLHTKRCRKCCWMPLRAVT